jgi:hypothetical protein
LSCNKIEKGRGIQAPRPLNFPQTKNRGLPGRRPTVVRYNVILIPDRWAQLPVSGAPPPIGAKYIKIGCLLEFHHDLNRGTAVKSQVKNKKALDKGQESL